MSTPELVVVGGGGHAKVVIDTARAAGLSVVGCYDDDDEKVGSEILGVVVRGTVADLATPRGLAVVAVGDNGVRKALVSRLQGVKWATLVHPAATVAQDVQIGHGTVVFAGAVIQPGARIGSHCIVNTGATVDHDCVLGDYTHVGPGAHLSGTNTVGEGAFLGTGSSTIHGISVGAWSTVGVGAVVIRDVPDGKITVGNPARAIQSVSDE